VFSTSDGLVASVRSSRAHSVSDAHHELSSDLRNTMKDDPSPTEVILHLLLPVHAALNPMV
jgi:hypothetical protein